MSGRKNVLRHQVAAAQSLAASFSSAPTMITYLDNCSYQINITTSDSTGTFVVEGSNDYQEREAVQNPHNGNWVAIPLAGATPNPVAAAANDSILIDLNQLPFNAIRVSYAPTIAGTGVIDIFLESKAL